MTGSNSSSPNPADPNSPNSRPAPYVVTDPEQAAFLGDAELRVFLLPFLGRAASVSQVAAALGIKTNAMLYRVQQMEACGLLKLDHLEPRGGRAIRHYRAVADELFLPFTATSFESLETQIEHVELVQHQRFVRALISSRQQQMLEDGWGTLHSRDQQGHINVSRACLDSGGVRLPADGLPMSVWSDFPLPVETALELTQRLQALLNEYIHVDRGEQEDAPRYRLHIGFTREQ
jgi:hypothetical protein